jgi:hypothetical protein
MKRIAAAIALAALLAVAAPAAAKPKKVHYEGKTGGGQSVSFSLQGKRILDVDAYVAMSCVPTHGTPVTYTAEFNPPGSFKLGKTRKAKGVEYMAYKGDVTKYYTVKIKKLKGQVWRADLSMNFSYEEVTFGTFGELEQRFYICQGDDAFSFKAQ